MRDNTSTREGQIAPAVDSTKVVLPVISLWQPWASWVAWGWKPIETRKHSRFERLVGKRAGIHAAKKWDENAIKLAERYLGPAQIERTLAYRHDPPQGLLCTVFVWRHAVCEHSDAREALIECGTRRYGLFLEAIHRIEPPLRIKGRQGIWREICPVSVHGSYVAGVSYPDRELIQSNPSGNVSDSATGVPAKQSLPVAQQGKRHERSQPERA